MKRVTLLAAAACGAALASGCTRAAKEGLSAFTGAKGVYAQTQPPVEPLGAYPNIEVGAITDAFGGRTPPELLVLLPDKIRARLREEGLPTGGSGKTLLVQGKIIYYENAALMGEVFGPFEEAVSEFQLVDKDTGRAVAVANCIGRTNTTLTKGVSHKAEGLAKAVAKWIAESYPRRGETN